MKRISHEPGYVLHHYDWSESSVIIEALTRGYGRVALIAKGAKRPSSNFRPVLLPLQPLGVVDVQRAAEHITLAEIHADLTQEPQLALRLDAFCDDRLAQLVCHRADRLHDHAAPLLAHPGPRQAPTGAGHERLRNLQAGDRQPLQIGQR